MRLNLEQCLLCSNDSSIKDLCIQCNKNFYPKENDLSNIGIYIKCYDESIKKEGYYLDTKDYLYKKCYETCEICEQKGNYSVQNCLMCKSTFPTEIKFNNSTNCYVNCEFYFYFENISYYFCTEKNICPNKYNKLIKNKKQCIDNCLMDDIYKFEFRNECYKECPYPESKISNVNPNFCEVICTEEKPFVLIQEQKCVENCRINEIKNNLCVLKFPKNETIIEREKSSEEIKAKDKFMENIETEFTSGEYNTSNIDSGQDDVIEKDNMKITLKAANNKENNTNYNITQINLGECENKLRLYYNISKEKSLYLKQIEVNQDGMKIPKIEYDIYSKLNGNNLVKLNKSVCRDVKVDIFIPIIISENIDKLNSSSGYYNDICYVTTSESGTDISLKDRKNEFINNNKTVCQEDCDFSEYDFNTNNAKCKCKVKESAKSFADMNIDKTKLLNNFINVKNFANLYFMKCYKVLFNKNGILYNIGFYIIALIIIFHFISMIIFYVKQFDKIKDIIKNIIFGVINWKLVIKERKEKIRIKKEQEKKRKENIMNKLINKNNKKSIINRKENKKPIIINQLNLINNLNKSKNKYEENDDKNIFKIMNPIDYSYAVKNNLIKTYFNSNPPKKRIKLINKNMRNNLNLINNLKKNENKNKNKRKKKETNVEDVNSKIELKKDMDKKEKIELTKKIMKYNDQELNQLSYNLALKYDMRSYCEYYISLLKTKHNFFFSFCNNDDYNSKIIKINLFFVSYAIYYTVNALFFNDATMHKLYEDEGKFNFIYQLPQILYSSLISIVLNTLLKLLALSQDGIIELKNLKDKKNKGDINIKEVELKDKLSIKFIIYFIISTSFLFFFWYYLSMFCAIYKNTQIHLISDTLISFGLSLVYPFAIYLFPGLFRIPALNNKKNKRNYLYQFSKLLQML